MTRLTCVAECKVTEIAAKTNNFVSFNSQGARRVSGGSGGIATAKIKRIRTAEGSGGGRGRERGRRANVMTRTTGTQRSTGVAEATTRTCPHLETASCSSASEHNPPPFVALISKSSSSDPLLILLVPSLQGCCCYLYDLLVGSCISGTGLIQPSGFTRPLLTL